VSGADPHDRSGGFAVGNLPICRTKTACWPAGSLDFNINSVEGMCIIRAGSREEAEAIAAN
jgi:hypothetical protein